MSEISKFQKALLNREKNFKFFSSIKEDISTYPLKAHLNTSVETNKSKSKEFGEVFTPLWLVDEMIGQAKVSCNTTTLDLCAGYGQFTIRLMRKLMNKYGSDKPNQGFNPSLFLAEKHSFVELQLSSCYKLLKTFSGNINLFIGDATKLPKLPGIAKGIWVYIEDMNGWAPLTKTVRHMCSNTSEDVFVKSLQNVIDNINKGYVAMKETMMNIKHSAGDRLHALEMLNETLNNVHPENKSVKTPREIVDSLLAEVDGLDKKQILVMFNAEIIEELIHAKKINPKNITFGVDDANKVRAVFVKDMYDVDSCVFADNKPTSILKALGRKHWDLVLSNPPYNDNLDLKIITALVKSNTAKQYVIVHPSVPYLDKKGKKSAFVAYKATLINKVKSLQFFNGNPIFGIGLWYPCVITHIDTDHTGDIVVGYFGDKYRVSSFSEELRYGDRWQSLVKPLYDAVVKYISRHGNVWDHNRKEVDTNKAVCQFSPVRGNVVGNHTRAMYKDDFYTIVRKDAEKAKAITKAMDNRPGPTFQFNTSVERDNFVDYLRTDFARFCLSFLKISQNIYYGEMSLIPWLDFTQSWDDEKLFKHFNVDQKTQDYIRSFLPDYYGIRKPLTSNDFDKLSLAI